MPPSISLVRADDFGWKPQHQLAALSKADGFHCGASTRTNATFVGRSDRFTQACAVPRWISTSPACSTVSSPSVAGFADTFVKVRSETGDGTWERDGKSAGS